MTNYLAVIQGDVEVSLAGSGPWVPAKLNQTLRPGDRVRTGERSRADIYLAGGMVIQKSEFSEIEIPPTGNVVFRRGIFKIFDRERDHRLELRMPTATAAIRGTDFLVRVGDDGTSEIIVLDGSVALKNAHGEVLLANNERGLAEPGQPPRKSAVIEAVNDLIQWNLYYPAVVDVDTLGFTAAEQQALAPSLDEYRAGDLVRASDAYDWKRANLSDAETIYRAELLLSLGQVDEAKKRLDTAPSLPAASALLKLIKAVKFERTTDTHPNATAAEWLAESYYQQSLANLPAARLAARRAADLAPGFGFAWERVAELEFCFGRSHEALIALDKSLELSPRNAQALALKGFLLAAQNNIRDATRWFDRAIATDGALGNAWLGRGLCRIHTGRRSEGLRDLLMAAALEPQRSLLRSYLAKGFSDAGENVLADKEIRLALQLDPGDPTGWLYSALIEQQQNQVNPAITDMEKSESLNDNRQIFRSKMLLDQDNAVRSVNLATMYDDADMYDVGVREAARAVTYDYDNASAHLFLSDSYNALRDPTGFNLRYDTAWFNELLLANLLAPVGADRLSQTLSYQEYSKLFESDGPGFADEISWRSDGELNEMAGQYGTYKNTSWAADLDYQHNNGVRANNQLDDTSGDVTVKQQLTPSDTVLGIAQFENYHSGDNFQYYNFYTAYRTNYEYGEHQDPTFVGGYQHEWSPGNRTLVLGGRLEDEQHFSQSQAPQLAVYLNPSGTIADVFNQPFDVALQDELLIYTAEFCQIVQQDRYTLIVGGRWQGGQFTYSDSLTPNPPSPPLFDPASGSFSAPFQRLDGYGYLTVKPVDKLWLTGGFAYDAMTYPANFRNVPDSGGTDERQLPEPKAAIVWSPLKQVTLRGVYARSLGGVSLDDSYRLEPTELAGFVQTFRSVIPESIVGSVSAEDVQLEGLALDLKFNHGTFAGLEAQNLDSTVRQTIGDFLFPNTPVFQPFAPSTTPQSFNYYEQSFSASINQLLPDGFVAGLSYNFTHSELKTTYPQIPAAFLPSQDQWACLHQIGAYLLFNHPSGLFAQFDAHGYLQQNYGYSPAEPGNDFVQLDLEGGWRFFQRRAELLVGILNLTGQNYSLNPLNVYSELPRKCVFYGQFSFEF